MMVIDETASNATPSTIRATASEPGQSATNRGHRGFGVPGLHFHDLRHTGNTFAAATKTSLRDLMARMGHDNPRAALIYQHATSEADHAIAKAVNAAVEQERKKTRKPRRRQARKRPDGPDDGAAGVLAKVS